MRYLTADFGSTYTKVTAIDTDVPKIVGTGAAFTTIETDVMEGLHNAFRELEKEIGKEWTPDKFLCCSSAAGGLKMVASGLVPDLTAKAARMAAASAGAKVMKTYSYEITHTEAEEIERLDPDLFLLCGGTDGGNVENIIHNAEVIGRIPGHFSTVVAGNKAAEEEVARILTEAGKPFVITENVMPNFNSLNIAPAKKCIMQLFIDRIIEAKGLSKAQERADNEIIPTPLAVLNACNLLSDGTKNRRGLGELLAIDLGGATTDVYSVGDGEPHEANIMHQGIPEPYSKRTVEGDLGMRYSLTALSEQLDLDAVAAKVGLTGDKLRDWVARCDADKSTRAETEDEILCEKALAKGAVSLATDRHVGHTHKVYSPMGEFFTINGKDLTLTDHVLGIGGALIHSADPTFILDGATFNISNYDKAKPLKPDFYLDSHYIMASMGLLSEQMPDVALELMLKELVKVGTKKKKQ